MSYTRHLSPYDEHYGDPPDEDSDEPRFFKRLCRICKGNRWPKSWRKLCKDCDQLAQIADWSASARDVLRTRYVKARS